MSSETLGARGSGERERLRFDMKRKQGQKGAKALLSAQSQNATHCAGDSGFHEEPLISQGARSWTGLPRLKRSAME